MKRKGLTLVNCEKCIHLMPCARQNNGMLEVDQAVTCPYFSMQIQAVEHKPKKICPFERQNREIDGAYCLGSDCAWWDAPNNNCVVFRPVWDAADSLNKEIETVLHGGIIQGGED